MQMAYIAIDPKTNHCYAISSADPDFVEYAAEDVKQWKEDGSVVELLPVDEAKERFCADLKPKEGKNQLKLFEI